jgi:hypothetical protein
MKVDEQSYWKSRCGAAKVDGTRCIRGALRRYGGRCHLHGQIAALDAAVVADEVERAQRMLERPRCDGLTAKGTPRPSRPTHGLTRCLHHHRTAKRVERKRLVLGKPIVPRCTHVDGGGARCFAFVDVKGTRCDAHRPRVEPSTRSRCAHVGRSGFRCGNVAARGTHCAMHEVVVQEAAE